jgi:type I restriction enzyme S subunit
MAVGRTAINLVDVAINQDVKALLCKPNLDARYLLYFLRSRQSVLEEQAEGATVKGITLDVIRALPIPLPTLGEQKRIAAMLDKADRLRRARRYAQQLGDSFLQAAFFELMREDACHFPVATVEELAPDKPNAIRTGPFGSQLLHSEFTDQGTAVLGIDNVVNNRFEWAKRRYITPGKFEQLRRYTVYPGDVLITIMGTCGRCAVVPADIGTAINTKHLCCITLDRTHCLPTYLQGAFLYHLFVRQQLRVATKGAIMDGLNMEIIKRLKIPLPPLSTQLKYATLANRQERLGARQREAERQAEHLFQTLLHQAFSASC